MPDNDLREAFLTASVHLTGFDRVTLVGTGVADVYLETIKDAVPANLLENTFNSLNDPQAGISAVLADPAHGPVAKAVTVLWYTGTWNALDKQWHDDHDSRRSEDDVTHLVSAEAYKVALQWAAIGAHPPGANPTGFGSWAEPPEATHV